MADDEGFVSELITNVEGRISRLLEKIVPNKKTYAPFLQFVDNVTIPGGQTIGVVRFPGPTRGRFWYVRFIRTSGVSPTTVAAGRADIFIGPDDLRNIPALAQAPISMWRDQMATIPAVTAYAHGALRVGPQEAVYVVFSGATAAQQYIASCEAYEFPDVDEDIDWII